MGGWGFVLKRVSTITNFSELGVLNQGARTHNEEISRWHQVSTMSKMGFLPVTSPRGLEIVLDSGEWFVSYGSRRLWRQRYHFFIEPINLTGRPLYYTNTFADVALFKIIVRHMICDCFTTLAHDGDITKHACLPWRFLWGKKYKTKQNKRQTRGTTFFIKSRPTGRSRWVVLRQSGRVTQSITQSQGLTTGMYMHNNRLKA